MPELRERGMAEIVANHAQGRQSSRAPTLIALRTALVYAVVGWVWIAASDDVVHLLTPNAEKITEWSILKGTFFILVTAFLLFLERRTSERRVLRLHRLNQMINAFAPHIALAQGRQELFETACTIATTIGPFPFAWIGEVDPATRECSPLAAQGEPENALETVGYPPQQRTHPYGPSETTARLGIADTSRDIAVDPRLTHWRSQLLAAGFRSFASFPLKVNGVIAGVFTLYAGTPNSFRAPEMALLEQLALDISYALELLDRAERRVAVEATLRDNAQRIHAIFDQAAVGIAQIDLDGRILEANVRLGEMLGIPPNDLTTKVLMEFMRGDPPARSWLHDMIQEKKQTLWAEQEYARHDGESIRAQLSATLINGRNDRPSYCIAVLQDISERNKAEARLQQRTDELVRINRAIIACAHTMSVHEASTYLLREALAITGMERSSLHIAIPEATFAMRLEHTGTDAVTVAQPAETVQPHICMCGVAHDGASPLIQSAPDQGMPAGLKSHVVFPIHSRQSIIGTLCVGSPSGVIPAADAVKLLETISSSVSIALDNAVLFEQTARHASTLERRVEERTAQLEASNKELESFSYSVSHDLRAPLRAIDGFSKLLDEEYRSKLDKEGRRFLGIILKNTRRMENLINDLLAFSRMGKSEVHYGKVNMQEGAREAFKELTEHLEKSPEFTLCPLEEAYGDAMMLKQVWLNLLSNAVKFSRKREHAVVEVGMASREGQLWYFVRDNGVGFDMAFSSKLFGVFQRLHSFDDFEGTGVGLAIVHRIIDRHHGQVAVEAGPDRGATFLFTLPRGGKT